LPVVSTPASTVVLGATDASALIGVTASCDGRFTRSGVLLLLHSAAKQGERVV
jgi:hypothetical protein